MDFMVESYNMRLLSMLPGAEYDQAVRPYTQGLKSYVERMASIVREDGPLSKLLAFRESAVYCSWPIRQLEYSFADRCVSSLAVTGPLLDVGSGVTPWPHFLASQGWPVVAVDTELDQTIAMRLHGADAFGQAVEHRVGDIRGLSIDDRAFAVVTCISVLEHLYHADIPLALAEMIRVLRPGGRLIITLDVSSIDDPFARLGQGAVPVDTLEHIYSPIAAACGSTDMFNALLDQQRDLHFADLEAFWTQHWQPELWHEKNRGYIAAGLTFDLPADGQRCDALIDVLKEISLHMSYPISEPYYHVQSTTGANIWLDGAGMLATELDPAGRAYEVRRFAEHVLRSGDTALDFGAGAGSDSLLFARLVGPGGRVHAFEMDTQHYGSLVRNTLREPIISAGYLGLFDGDSSLSPDRGRQSGGYLDLPSAQTQLSHEIIQNDSSLIWKSLIDAELRRNTTTEISLMRVHLSNDVRSILLNNIAPLLDRTSALIFFDTDTVLSTVLAETYGFEIFRYNPSMRRLEHAKAEPETWLVASNPVALPFIENRLASYGGAEPSAEETHALRDRLFAALQRTMQLYEDLHNSQQQFAQSLQHTEQLTDHLAVSESDRTARLEVIKRLQLQVEQLQAQLALSEADRAARLDVIHDQEAVNAQLRQQLAQLERDRSAEREAARRLQAELATLHNHPIIKLERKIKRSE